MDVIKEILYNCPKCNTNKSISVDITKPKDCIKLNNPIELCKCGRTFNIEFKYGEFAPYNV